MAEELHDHIAHSLTPALPVSSPASPFKRFLVFLTAPLRRRLLQPVLEQQNKIYDALQRRDEELSRREEESRRLISILQRRDEASQRQIGALQQEAQKLQARYRRLEETVETLTTEKESIEQHLASLQTTYDLLTSQSSALAEMGTLMRDIQCNHTELAAAVARRLSAQETAEKDPAVEEHLCSGGD